MCSILAVIAAAAAQSLTATERERERTNGHGSIDYLDAWRVCGGLLVCLFSLPPCSCTAFERFKCHQTPSGGRESATDTGTVRGAVFGGAENGRARVCVLFFLQHPPCAPRRAHTPRQPRTKRTHTHASRHTLHVLDQRQYVTSSCGTSQFHSQHSLTERRGKQNSSKPSSRTGAFTCADCTVLFQAPVTTTTTTTTSERGCNYTSKAETTAPNDGTAVKYERESAHHRPRRLTAKCLLLHPPPMAEAESGEALAGRASAHTHTHSLVHS